MLTSATLADDNGFRFLATRLGLDDAALAPKTGIYESPFAYPRQAILVIPTDVSAPNVDAAAHLQAVVRVALDVTLDDGHHHVPLLVSPYSCASYRGS